MQAWLFPEEESNVTSYCFDLTDVSGVQGVPFVFCELSVQVKRDFVFIFHFQECADFNFDFMGKRNQSSFIVS